MKKHWTARDFVVTRRESNTAGLLEFGYCQKCQGDMHRLYGGVLSHYKSHQNAKRAGVW